MRGQRDQAQPGDRVGDAVLARVWTREHRGSEITIVVALYVCGHEGAPRSLAHLRYVVARTQGPLRCRSCARRRDAAQRRARRQVACDARLACDAQLARALAQEAEQDRADSRELTAALAYADHALTPPPAPAWAEPARLSCTTREERAAGEPHPPGLRDALDEDADLVAELDDRLGTGACYGDPCARDDAEDALLAACEPKRDLVRLARTSGIRLATLEAARALGVDEVRSRLDAARAADAAAWAAHAAGPQQLYQGGGRWA